MARRSIHYEAAFEDYLRSRGLPYVAVDETKKAIFADAAVKSFDFLVYSGVGRNLLVDVKGRKFPDSAAGRQRSSSRAWENWITRQDVEGLGEWEKVFGDDFRAVLVFAYWLQGPVQRAPFDDVHIFGEKSYGFVGIGLDRYVAGARTRSPKWETITMPTAEFRKEICNIADML
ncbi:MAG: HYExAFE family protein [Phycisphaerae bacterium]|jgi:hypothetical protein|nr:HYExAFE family protein [Phycisphaerae bacterium]MDP7289058.1 HYExAFE family protein [Phycisphaerae bacterium]